MSEEDMRLYGRLVKVRRLEKMYVEVYEQGKRTNAISTGSDGGDEPAGARGRPPAPEAAEAPGVDEYDPVALRELRPNLDPAQPLLEVIRAENTLSHPSQSDDRVIKRLERKYGKRRAALTFSGEGGEGDEPRPCVSPLTPLRKQIKRK